MGLLTEAGQQVPMELLVGSVDPEVFSIFQFGFASCSINFIALHSWILWTKLAVFHRCDHIWVQCPSSPWRPMAGP